MSFFKYSLGFCTFFTVIEYWPDAYSCASHENRSDWFTDIFPYYFYSMSGKRRAPTTYCCWTGNFCYLKFL